jgi:hypothetical protein
MTIQRRALFELKDLVSVQFRCRKDKCGSIVSLSLNPENLPTVPAKCPICSAEWIATTNKAGGSAPPEMKIVVDLLNAIWRVRDKALEKVEIRFEIESKVD